MRWRVPWPARSNQSMLRVINSEYSFERLMLKLQYSSQMKKKKNKQKNKQKKNKPWVSRSLQRRMGWQGPAAGLGALSVAVHAWDLLKEAAIICITSAIVWPQVKNWEGMQPHPFTDNWIKDSLNMALPIRTRPNFLLSLSVPS